MENLIEYFRNIYKKINYVRNRITKKKEMYVSLREILVLKN